MIGFISKNWRIAPQTIKVGKVEVEVACKPCRWTPYDKDDGGTGFCLGQYWSWRVLLENLNNLADPPVEVKLRIKSGERGPDGKVIWGEDEVTGLKIVFKPLKGHQVLWGEPVLGYREMANQRLGVKTKKTKAPTNKDNEIPFESVTNGLAEVAKRFGEGMKDVIENLFTAAIEETVHSNEDVLLAA